MENHAGTPEPELVYARKGEIEALHDEIERLRAERDEWKMKWESMAAASLMAGTLRR
jgi:hypothetical protein